MAGLRATQVERDMAGCHLKLNEIRFLIFESELRVLADSHEGVRTNL
jgi:hypothetical protein